MPVDVRQEQGMLARARELVEHLVDARKLEMLMLFVVEPVIGDGRKIHLQLFIKWHGFGLLK
jgi:hypothetical protein